MSGRGGVDSVRQVSFQLDVHVLYMLYRFILQSRNGEIGFEKKSPTSSDIFIICTVCGDRASV